jgi:hypothetical protein
MSKAFAAYDPPKRISSGYLYHWWLLDGSFDRTFKDPNLLSLGEQRDRFKKLKNESPAYTHLQAINYLRKVEPEDVLRRRMIDMDPELQHDPEFWGKSYGQLLYENEDDD